MAWIEIRGVQFYLRILNAEGKDTVVMTHGLFGNHTIFYRCGAKTLADLGYRVVMYDMRGHGLSGYSDRGYTLAELADDMFDVMDALKIDAAHLLGFSLGANIVLKAVLMHPERVKSVVLLEPSGMKQVDLDQVPNDESGIDAFIADYTEATGLGILPKNRVDLGQRVLRLAEQHAKECLERDINFFAVADLESINKPVLLLCGKQSPFADDQKLALQRIPGASMKVRKGNHYLPITQSVWVKNQLPSFFPKVQ